jgi:hypothetical protein
VDLGAELKGKVGPFPLYVWLLLMTGAALVAYLFLKKKGGKTGTPGTPCTMADGSSGTWDSSGTVCQATTVSTVNVPSMAGDRNWRAQSTTATATTTPTTTAGASTPAATGSTTPPESPPVSTTSTGPGSPKSQTPATVSGLHVTSTGKNSIGLAWSKSANATSYQVRVTYQSKVIQTATTTTTTHTVAGLQPNRTYGLHVVAINGSNWAPEASITQKTSA